MEKKNKQWNYKKDVTTLIKQTEKGVKNGYQPQFPPEFELAEVWMERVVLFFLRLLTGLPLLKSLLNLQVEALRFGNFFTSRLLRTKAPSRILLLSSRALNLNLRWQKERLKRCSCAKVKIKLKKKKKKKKKNLLLHFFYFFCLDFCSAFHHCGTMSLAGQ